MPLVPVMPVIASRSAGRLIEVGAQPRQRTASVRHLRPSHSFARLLARGVGDDCHRAGCDCLVDELVPIARLASHGDEHIARLYPARVVFQPADARITALGEDFRAVQKLKEIHWIFYCELTPIQCSERRRAMPSPTRPDEASGPMRSSQRPNFTVTRDPVATCDPGCRRLLPGQPAAYRIQIEATFLGQFDRAAHALARERRHHDSTLLRVQHNRAAGWKMIGSGLPRSDCESSAAGDCVGSAADAATVSLLTQCGRNHDASTLIPASQWRECLAVSETGLGFGDSATSKRLSQVVG